MIQSIPLKLKADPIIDAVIEVRLKATQPLSDVLPGVLMQMLGDNMGAVQRLPIADIPKQFRDNDPNLIYKHIVKIDLQGYSLFIGDRSVALSCVMPYPSGNVFKAKAIEILKSILSLSIIEEVERFSIKYTDFIEGEQLDELIKYLDLDIVTGQKNISAFQAFNLQLSSIEDEIINLVKIIAIANLRRIPSKGNAAGETDVKKGILLEVESIQNLDSQSANEFNSASSTYLDKLHQSNKKQFFSLLTPYALEKLGASNAISDQ